ncbi:MAG: Tryptophan 2,3-dioxygenase [Labilithrix sp.]|nr:Tryptophan 2,3-dioxygenase [Labilithrix sp.]
MNTKDDDKRAGNLRAALEQPIFNRALGKEVGTGVLDYEVYLKTNALYALQTCSTELTVPDEHLFQVMHQSQELWLKEIAFEVISVIDALDDRRIHEACGLLDRIVVIQQCLANEIRILQTLTPDTFQEIRRNLGNGSGLESPGYNRVLIAADAAEHAFDALVERSGLALLDLYRGGETRDEMRDGLKRVAELFVDWDEAFQAWLVAHFMLVRRTIGVHRKVRALDGFPTQALAPRMTKPLFAKLWDVRVELTQSWERDGGHAPGAPRPSAGGETAVAPPAAAPRSTERAPPPRVTDRPSAPDAVPEP